mgnify:CR=1 FL=1
MTATRQNGDRVGTESGSKQKGATERTRNPLNLHGRGERI